MAAVAIIVALGTCLAVSGIGNRPEEQPTPLASAGTSQRSPIRLRPSSRSRSDRASGSKKRRGQQANTWSSGLGSGQGRPLASPRLWAGAMGPGSIPSSWRESRSRRSRWSWLRRGMFPKELRWDGENLAGNHVVGLERRRPDRWAGRGRAGPARRGGAGAAQEVRDSRRRRRGRRDRRRGPLAVSCTAGLGGCGREARPPRVLGERIRTTSQSARKLLPTRHVLRTRCRR